MADANPLDRGMTLRDRFAFQAMNALISFRGTDRKPDILGRNSYELADAMLAARGEESAEPALRDRIAGLAMNGLITVHGTSSRPNVVARLAYEIADGMLEARGAG